MASNDMNSNMLSEFQYYNAKELQTVKKAGVKILEFPDEVMSKAKEAMEEVAQEKSKKSKDFAKVWDDVQDFLSKNREWTDVGLKKYLEVRDS